ncbi:preprotein translocase subunit SecA [Thiomicrospira aerophila AL3]|uniref:Protein translocase subunit SecA n=1 Tax=Thiomicrospira aerophila AL3 TaxID=717772 RepID=W0DQ19_9GAMM|nr:preprotein translocase subunit SecA [Thiomicrospira aerophila]AHF00562.1 preprotein translocase subunit SecA [Thiomicrospira aerophila AL3]
MFMSFLQKLLGNRNQRLVKQYQKRVALINAHEEAMAKLTDEALQAKTGEFKFRLASNEALNDILPEAFAVVREAGKRVLGMRHYDVQMIGGMALNDGRIAEMRTGEGKTLVATLPAYLNALAGGGVHVITVNDYLAKRDAEWMSQLYGFLGLTTGVILSGQSHQEKQLAYAMDITYGTNNEFGFDYLRDNMAIFKEERVMRGQAFAIIDEVDSILIDEARTPLIISGPAENKAQVYHKINPLISHLERGEEDPIEKTATGDYTVDEKNRQVYLTEQGHEKIENLLAEVELLKDGESLYDATNIGLMIHVNAALRAHVLFERNRDYIVDDGQVIIIDEHTGRKMIGRRWGEGLHQAVEAKEGLEIQSESQTFASITFQNYFRQYQKLSGMTGTADTEAGEFLSTYKLEVVVIPPNKTPQREDLTDLVFLDVQSKFKAIVEDVKATHAKEQPVLIGTASIEMSELLSAAFTQSGVKHEVLNAKQHEREAHIIANAGRTGAVTIATNMAGRGTDIVLGGSLDVELEELGPDADAEAKAKVKAAWQLRHDRVLELGGLKVIGSERHESRRIDNQLRGRSGRQGDPGVTRFYLSLDDDLMRRFASEKVKNMMRRLGMAEGEAIEHPMVSRSIERAQKQVERLHQDERANLLKFDDVSNEQRKVVYQQRNELMESEEVRETIKIMREDVVNEIVDDFIAPGSLDEQWRIPELNHALEESFGIKVDVQAWLDADASLYEETLREKIVAEVQSHYDQKMAIIDEKTLGHFEKELLLRNIDKLWREHLSEMDYLRRGIHLRGFAQRDPFQEYRREAALLFQGFLNEVKKETIKMLSLVQLHSQQDVAAFEKQQQAELEKDMQQAQASHPAAAAAPQAESPATSNNAVADNAKEQTFRRETPKLGRNDPCSCGSGKKYKHCCGKLD